MANCDGLIIVTLLAGHPRQQMRGLLLATTVLSSGRVPG
uniref:Uncharacterized protein n=1 Tax=Arundo donax TaxID=35708 RepID=A0A0A9AZU7_ARUDO